MLFFQRFCICKTMSILPAIPIGAFITLNMCMKNEKQIILNNKSHAKEN